MTKSLKSRAEAAKKVLAALGCPVLPGGNWSPRSLFEISGESGLDAANGWPWADYYINSESMPFGVNVEAEKVLRKHGLYAEWINGGVLGVYEG